jgi:hypothetical protein
MSMQLTTEKRVERLIAFLADRFPAGAKKYPKLTKHFWDEIDVLKKDKQRTLKIGKSLAKSKHDYERFFAYSLMGQVCNPLESREESIGVEVVRLLSGAASSETSPALLQSIAYALGHIYSIAAMPAIYKLSFHANEGVRYAATMGYSSGLDVDGENLEPRYVQRVIELTRDSDPDIRDWATFAIAQQIPLAEVDNNEIRQALIDRTHDRHFDTKSEAYIGLANRGDISQVEQFGDWLAVRSMAGPLGKLNIEASGKFGSPSFYSSLLKIREWWGDDTLMQWALARCSPDAAKRAKAPSDYDPYKGSQSLVEKSVDI